MLDHGVRRRTHCALARSVQTTAASQFTKCVCPSAHAPPPALRFSARTEGNPANIHSGHRVARPSLRSAWRLRQRGGAERSNGPCGCSAVHPPAGCACGGVVAGWHGRRSAHASCSDSPWLSERRCAAAKRVPRRTPQPPRRRRSQQGWDSRTSRQPNSHSGHRCARLGPRSAWRLRPRVGAERSNGTCGCSSPFAPLDAPRSAGFGGSGLAIV